ncbi:hypothetical protein JX265_012985 [Neoarthrinium moseri]|uniref:C2H2-type domain-containing protein n=1 Tax=Neoarthrinium moseri TaxID=1658444 RepID=A0A9P9W9M4_9PEZI|nr:hypothetical protein JX265_012985 [Neoarthrinium moseri]
MDGSHYPSNVIGTSAPSYPSPAAISPHQLQNGHLPPHTLPPLQPQNPAMQSIYGSHPHTPRTPGTSGPPTPTNNMSSYPPPPQNNNRGGYQQMMPNPYPQSHQGYGTSASMMPQSSVAQSHPQPIAPAPATRPPVLRPMPAGGVMPQSGLSSPYGQSPLMPHQQSILQQEADQPTHVVGSQGRRGILPSAPGRPAAPTGPGAGKSTVIPQKDADGKFPCPHCTKTYLHAKHLKRHLLRHTGDRPYMCVLCRDTFSRSDILKRHFQKCSIRRGNPTGASHLSHPSAHVKKHQAAQAKAAADGELNQINGMNSMQGNGMQGDNVVHPFGMVPMSDGMPNMSNDQSQLSRSSSISRMDDNNRDRRSMTGGGSVYGNDVQSSMASNINPQLANYNMPQSQNGMQMFAGSNSNQQNLDWSMFQAGAQDTYNANSFQPPNLGQTQVGTKPEHHNLDAARAAVNDMNDRSLFFSNWITTPTIQDPYQYISNQIHTFFHPPGTVITNQTAGVTAFFSPTNIKDFLEHYSHYHCHFAFLHIPTFRILEAYTGLLASMCCAGACYSSRASPEQVRESMNFLKIALERDSNLFSGSAMSDTKPSADTSSAAKGEIEKLQALVLMSQLLVWNGTPMQRDSARRLFPQVADIARKLGLLQVSSSPDLYSVLHQPNLALSSVTPDNFDWHVWICQESRIRLMYMLYLSDVAYGLYFNLDAQFSNSEMHIPLPSDDAAWEASTSTECAEALHLYGSEAARLRNPDGSQRSKQPELNLAMRALYHESYQIHPGSTNLYGKFILIHALLAQIRRAQLEGSSVNISRSATPLSQSDWAYKMEANINGSANNSGRATPVPGQPPLISSQVYKSICVALDKFKSNWDMDMAIQFPPTFSNSRRYGFSRDGIHFYYLAKWLLKSTDANDLRASADRRFAQVIQFLKNVKTWVLEDGAKRGEELGSVGEIDHAYGVTDLTLNMADLFKPLPQVVQSPHMPTIKTDI